MDKMWVGNSVKAMIWGKEGEKGKQNEMPIAEARKQG